MEESSTKTLWEEKDSREPGKKNTETSTALVPYCFQLLSNSALNTFATTTGVPNRCRRKMLIFKEKSTFSSEEEINFMCFYKGTLLTTPKNNLRTIETVHSTPLLLGVPLTISCSLPEFFLHGCLKSLQKNLRNSYLKSTFSNSCLQINLIRFRFGCVILTLFLPFLYQVFPSTLLQGLRQGVLFLFSSSQYCCLSSCRSPSRH